MVIMLTSRVDAKVSARVGALTNKLTLMHQSKFSARGGGGGGSEITPWN